MKKSAKQELLSRLLVSSSVFILGSPIVTQAVVSIPAAAETISTSEIEEATLSTSENLSEQQVSEPAVTEETTTSETGGKEKAVEQETVETTQVEETEPDQRTEQSAENASTEEDTENSMAVDESQEVKSALAENILWTGMWGTAPATLDIEGVLTVGAGTLTTAVDQVIPLTEELKNMVIKKLFSQRQSFCQPMWQVCLRVTPTTAPCPLN